MPHRAVFWPSGFGTRDAREPGSCPTLIVADLHLGKTETYLVNGVALPGALMAEQLTRLGAAIVQTGAQRVLIVGDLLHAPAGLTSEMISHVAAWRAERPIEFAIVPGNHDRRLEAVAEPWNLTILPERYDEGPFSFRHIPEPSPDRYTWAGHEHPAVTVGRGHSAVKIAAFHIGERLGILPAFSKFTAGGPIRRRDGDFRARLFAIAENEVMDVTRPLPRGMGFQPMRSQAH